MNEGFLRCRNVARHGRILSRRRVINPCATVGQPGSLEPREPLTPFEKMPSTAFSARAADIIAIYDRRLMCPGFQRAVHLWDTRVATSPNDFDWANRRVADRRMVWRSRACLAAGPPPWTGLRLNAVVAQIV